MTAAVAATGPNMNEAVKGGGGDYTPPEAGACRLRFIGYVEVGKHENNIPGKPPKTENQVWLTFELSGPKHAPKVLESGEKIPHRLTLRLNHSLNEKAAFFKLFKRMNYKGAATHMSQLLGDAFRGTVVHTTKGEGAEKVTYANLKDDAGFTIAPPRYEDPETGEQRELAVDAAISPLRLFVWNAEPAMLKQMWDCIFIDGTAGEGDKQRSLNVFQDKIKSAVNFAGSPIALLLAGNGQTLDLPETSSAPAKTDDDPLNSMV